MNPKLVATVVTAGLSGAGAPVDAAPVQPERPQGDKSVSLTIYSTAQPGAIPPELYRPVAGDQNALAHYPIPGYAMVRDRRRIPIQQARARVSFTDVAALIDPTTVKFVSLTDPDGTSVVEQSYQFDLVSQAKLLERYLDRGVTVVQARGQHVEEIRGTLLSARGGLILRTPDGGIATVANYATVLFPELPGGLLTRPTLVWDVHTAATGDHDVRVSYQTSGITWWTDYNLIFTESPADANAGELDVSAWVSILNQSGASYENARLKLIAGDVQRIQPPTYPAVRGAAELDMAMARAAGFAEKPFFEFHLYTLGRDTTIPDRSTKQIELFPAVHSVPAEKVLVYYGLDASRWFFPSPQMDRELGAQGNTKIDVYLKFSNDKPSGLGIPLPSGRIRVNKLDTADGSLEFIGEDTIDHTARDEQVLIRLGSAFDAVGERKQLDFRINRAARWMEEDIEITIRNHKDQRVKVIIKENMYRWTNWSITRSTTDHEKADARTVHFPITVEKDAQETVRFTVRYTW